jgi:hypothetical protein
MLISTNVNNFNSVNQLFNSSSPLFPTVWGTIAAFVPGSVFVFSVLLRWNEMSKLSFSKSRLNLQNKYLITLK